MTKAPEQVRRMQAVAAVAGVCIAISAAILGYGAVTAQPANNTTVQTPTDTPSEVPTTATPTEEPTTEEWETLPTNPPGTEDDMVYPGPDGSFDGHPAKTPKDDGEEA